ncbi:MAG TPA: NADH:flavin oxidoreductase/NADH oxidase [Rhizomicrobium sp.]|jgi:NADPH2 dehydrogenase
MAQLFTPLALRGLTLKNRIVVAPMCQYAANDGQANSWHLIHLGSLAQSAAGMVCIEATAVEPQGRITPGCLGLWDDATESALRQTLSAIRSTSNMPITIQLAHAGRKGSSRIPWEGGTQIKPEDGGWTTVAPSALAHAPGEVPPMALDAAGMERIREAFGEAARRADRLGLDAIELHAAHGYLLHEFLSPIANRRDDAYGGTLENRMRFPLEIFETVRKAFPAGKPVGVKISATDWVEGGWDVEQSVVLAAELKSRNADWVTASSAGVSPLQNIPVGPGYQLALARRIREGAGITTNAIGLITEPRQAEDILTSGTADLVSLARGMLYDPRWPWHAAAALDAQVEAAPQYLRATPHGHKNLFRNFVHGAR